MFTNKAHTIAQIFFSFEGNEKSLVARNGKKFFTCRRKEGFIKLFVVFYNTTLINYLKILKYIEVP